jgi:hypothetical protein
MVIAATFVAALIFAFFLLGYTLYLGFLIRSAIS